LLGPAPAAAVTAALALCAALQAQPAQAVSACGLISGEAAAKDFHLAHSFVEPILSTTLPKVGASSSDCNIFLWNGHRPTTVARSRKKIANGTAAQLAIVVWAPDTKVLGSSWLTSGFPETLTEVTGEAQTQLVGSLGGKAFAPHPLGAEAVGYLAKSGKTRIVAAFWSSHTLGKIVELRSVEAKTNPAAAHLEKVAATAVPAFGL
jgi:hypothetical protein